MIDITPNLIAPLVLEQSNYLPYGTRIQGQYFRSAMADNRWRYAGKEEQDFTPFSTINLSLLDFGARMYDPYIARWTAVDPLAHSVVSISPLSYCINNPLSFVDRLGKEVGDYYSYFGHYVGSDGVDDGNLYLIDDLTITNYLNLDLSNSSPEEILQTLSVNADEIDGLIVIERTDITSEHTQGEFVAIGDAGFSGFTMERPGPPTTTPNQKKPIPTGYYDTEALSFDFAGGFAFGISNLDVPKTRHIYGHVGNTPKNSSGCVLFGLGLSTDGKRITQSRNAMSNFRTYYTNKDNVKMIIR